MKLLVHHPVVCPKPRFPFAVTENNAVHAWTTDLEELCLDFLFYALSWLDKPQLTCFIPTTVLSKL